MTMAGNGARDISPLAIKGFHICHLNIRSLWPKYPQLSEYLHMYKVACFGISETWLNEGLNNELLHIPSYTLYRLDRSWLGQGNAVKKGGGVCCYLSDKYVASSTEYEDLNCSNSDLECQWIVIQQKMTKPFIVCNLFRNQTGSLKAALDYIDQCLHKINLHDSRELFIIGDFNVDYKDPTNPNTKLIKKWETQMSLSQIIKNTTRYSVKNVINECRTTVSEVIKYAKQIHIHNSSAIHHVNSMVIRDLFLTVPDVIVKLFNVALDKAIFPDCWKTATIVPIFKSGDTHNVTNYRPVSLLPLPGKLFEKILLRHMNDFMEVCGTLTKDQGGFRKNRSTIDIVTQFTDDIFLWMNNKQTTLATYIDFSKAFDTVNHNIRLAKLEMNGIKGKTRDLIRSYLNSRKQRTMTNNKLSDTLAVNCGVPQGSILGPFLFLVYINDMSKLDLEYDYLQMIP